MIRIYKTPEHSFFMSVFSGRTTAKMVLVLSMFFIQSLVCKAQTQNDKIITGIVKSSADNTSIPGVNISVKGTTNAAVTDGSGKYSITASEKDVLVFSFIGYTTVEMKVGNLSVIDVSLVDDIKSLDEVVVVGYGSQFPAHKPILMKKL